MNKDKLSELREYYDNSSLPDSVDRAVRDDQIADEVLVSTSIRLPRSLMEQVRRRAELAGVPATTLMRQWITDRITAPDAEAVVSVADLQRLIAERAHPAA